MKPEETTYYIAGIFGRWIIRPGEKSEIQG